MHKKQAAASGMGWTLVLSGLFGLFILSLIILNALFYTLTTGDSKILLVCLSTPLPLFLISLNIPLGVVLAIGSLLVLVGLIMIKFSQAS